MFSAFIQTKLYCLFLFAFANLSIYAQSNYIPNPSSDISFKLSIPLSAMESAINDNLPQVLVNDTSFSDNDNDNTKTKITKGGKVKLSKYNDFLIGVEIPLNVEVEKRYGAMGLYNSEKFNFKMTMQSVISGKIDEQGNLKTTTTIRNFNFEKEPTISIAGVELSITSVVENELNVNRKAYAQAIDDNISENIPLKQMLIELLQYFTKPFKASDEYNAWIDYECQKMQYTPFVINNGNLESQINLVSRLKIYLQDSPMNTPIPNYLPIIESQAILPKQSEINSSIFIPNEEANKQANATMAGTDYSFKDEKYTIKVDSVIIDTEDNNLGINLETSGDFNGTISLDGFPYYNAENQSIYLQNPVFKAKTKNKMYQVALWLKKGSIQKQIADEYGFPVAENLQIIRQGIDDYLNTSYYDAIYLSGKTQEFDIQSIRVSNYGISINYQLKYDLTISLKSLKSF